MTIKLLAFVRRRNDVSPAEFHAHWRDRHGPLIRDTPELARHVRRYEQNHRLDADYERERGALERDSGDFDGVAVQWFDSLDGFRAFVAEPAMAEVFADEQRF
ncbi:MAG: EthD family reductase, partial [Acidimicrobiales bacterium]|nr:EthD family reductase [Acidimicrobiales bacterium]